MLFITVKQNKKKKTDMSPSHDKVARLMNKKRARGCVLEIRRNSTLLKTGLPTALI